VKIKVLIKKVKVVLRVRYLRIELSVLGRRLVLCCSENNVRKLKNWYKFTWFVVAKIRKSRDRCTSEKNIQNNALSTLRFKLTN
jgi:hypothetical protein